MLTEIASRYRSNIEPVFSAISQIQDQAQVKVQV